MSKTKLTGQERANRTFSRRDADRLPRHESFWGETIEHWQREGLCGNARPCSTNWNRTFTA